MKCEPGAHKGRLRPEAGDAARRIDAHQAHLFDAAVAHQAVGPCQLTGARVREDRRLETGRDLAADPDRFGHRQRSAAQPVGEGAPVDELEDEIRLLPRFPRPWMAPMLGWLSDASARPSRRNRVTCSRSRANASGSALIATSRPSRVSFAR